MQSRSHSHVCVMHYWFSVWYSASCSSEWLTLPDKPVKRKHIPVSDYYFSPPYTHQQPCITAVVIQYVHYGCQLHNHYGSCSANWKTIVSYYISQSPQEKRAKAGNGNYSNIYSQAMQQPELCKATLGSFRMISTTV